MKSWTSTIVLTGLAACCLLTASPAAAAVPAKYANCTNLQKSYPHGVGKANATDKVSSGHPVTTWKRDTAEYNRAMGHNRGLDRDRDGIACEKR